MQSVVMHKINDALHKLRTTAMVFRPIVKIDHQGGDVPKTLSHRFPPLGNAVRNAVTGDFGADTVEKHFI